MIETVRLVVSDPLTKTFPFGLSQRVAFRDIFCGSQFVSHSLT